MSDVLFDSGIDVCAQGQFGVLTVGLFKANAWVPDVTDAVIADATSAGATELAAAGYTRLSFIIGSISLDSPNHRELYTFDTLDFGTPDTGGDYDWLIVASQGSDDTDSRLVIAYDLTGSTTDGLPLSFNPDPDGVIQTVRP